MREIYNQKNQNTQDEGKGVTCLCSNFTPPDRFPTSTWHPQSHEPYFLADFVWWTGRCIQSPSDSAVTSPRNGFKPPFAWDRRSREEERFLRGFWGVMERDSRGGREKMEGLWAWGKQGAVVRWWGGGWCEGEVRNEPKRIGFETLFRKNHFEKIPISSPNT